MPKSLQSRKRQLVRDAIYDAAIDLFATHGFDETTIEEIAEAAGISRRSFFRYFETKDDLLALNTVLYGKILCETVESCPISLSASEVMRTTVLAGLKFSETQPRTRQIIEIAGRSASARQAHMSRLTEVEQKLVSAFAARTKSPSAHYQKPRLLAGLTLLLVNASIASWYAGEHKEMSTAAKQGFLTIARLFGDESSASSSTEGVAIGSKTATSAARNKSSNSRK